MRDNWQVKCEKVTFCVCVHSRVYISYILSHTAAHKNGVFVTACWQPYTYVVCVCMCVNVSVALWWFSQQISFLSLFLLPWMEKKTKNLFLCMNWLTLCVMFSSLVSLSLALLPDLLIISSDTQTFLLHIEPCKNQCVLPRLIGFMYCVTKACA